MHIRPIKTQELTKNLFVVRTFISNFYVYKQGDTTICFDTGYVPFLVKRGLKKIGIDPSTISHVFLTHTDYDHVGGLKVIKNGQVYLSKDEEVMITHKKPRTMFIFNKKIKRPYELLKDGSMMTIGHVKVKAMATPGHTPGSMTYIVNDGLIFSGDTLTVENNRVKPFFWFQNMNTTDDIASVKKVKKIKTKEMICTGHSGVISYK